MSTTSDGKIERKQFLNESLQTLLIDSLTVSKRSDDLYFLQGGINLPDGIREQVRLMIPEKALHAMLKVLCEQSGYCPEPAKKE